MVFQQAQMSPPEYFVWEDGKHWWFSRSNMDYMGTYEVLEFVMPFWLTVIEDTDEVLRMKKLSEAMKRLYDRIE